jgi:hypothetical protein
MKYVGKEHAQHLKNTLEEHYKLTCDWTGTRYIGITLDWDYKKTTGASVEAKLREESLETIPTHCRQTTALTLSERTNSIWCQEAIRSAIASQSSKPTIDTMQQTLQLLNYLATQEDAVLSYHASDMVLAVHSNASYLSEQSTQQSRGTFFPIK